MFFAYCFFVKQNIEWLASLTHILKHCALHCGKKKNMSLGGRRF